MRQLFIVTLALIFLGSGSAPVEAGSIKHLKSVYVDQEGGQLNRPEGVACDDKTLVVADTGNARLVIFGWEAQLLTPKSVLPLDGVSAKSLQMNSRGELYLYDAKTRAVLRIGADGTLAGKLDPKNLPDARTFIPRSFRIDKQDNLYLLDVFSGRVLLLDPAGQYQKQLPFPTDIGFASDLAISDQGAIFLLDSVAGDIYVANPGDEAFTLMSQGLKEFTNFPTHLTIDNGDTLYIADQYGSGLVLVGPDGKFLGRKFNMGWEDGQLNNPAQICIDDQNRMFIADKNNSRVQVFSIQED